MSAPNNDFRSGSPDMSRNVELPPNQLEQTQDPTRKRTSTVGEKSISSANLETAQEPRKTKRSATDVTLDVSKKVASTVGEGIGGIIGKAKNAVKTAIALVQKDKLTPESKQNLQDLLEVTVIKDMTNETPQEFDSVQKKAFEDPKLQELLGENSKLPQAEKDRILQKASGRVLAKLENENPEVATKLKTETKKLILENNREALQNNLYARKHPEILRFANAREQLTNNVQKNLGEMKTWTPDMGSREARLEQLQQLRIELDFARGTYNDAKAQLNKTGSEFVPTEDDKSLELETYRSLRSGLNDQIESLRDVATEETPIQEEADITDLDSLLDQIDFDEYQSQEDFLAEFRSENMNIEGAIDKVKSMTDVEKLQSFKETMDTKFKAIASRPENQQNRYEIQNYQNLYHAINERILELSMPTEPTPQLSTIERLEDLIRANSPDKNAIKKFFDEEFPSSDQVYEDKANNLSREYGDIDPPRNKIALREILSELADSYEMESNPVKLKAVMDLSDQLPY